jgi:HPt (histidine-containing phosphotransfer) domain-containing protein
MDGQGDPLVDADILAARAEFAHRLVTKTADLEALVVREEWDEVRRAAHKLCGSSGIYGFGVLSRVAAAIEEILCASKNAPDAPAQQEIREKLDEMRIEAARVSQEKR